MAEVTAGDYLVLEELMEKLGIEEVREMINEIVANPMVPMEQWEPRQ